MRAPEGTTIRRHSTPGSTLIAGLLLLLHNAPAASTTIKWEDVGQQLDLSRSTERLHALIVAPDTSLGPIDGILIQYVGDGVLKLQSRGVLAQGPAWTANGVSDTESSEAGSSRESLSLREWLPGSPIRYDVEVISGANFSIAAIELRAGRDILHNSRERSFAIIGAGAGPPFRPEPLAAFRTETVDSVQFSVSGASLDFTVAAYFHALGQNPQAVPFLALGDTAIRITLSANATRAGGRLTLLNSAGAGGVLALPATQRHTLIALLDEQHASTLDIDAPWISSIARDLPQESPLSKNAHPSLTRFAIITVTPDTPLSTALAKLRSLPGVTMADSTSPGPVSHTTPNDTYLPQQWALHDMAGSHCGGTIVALPGSGIDMPAAWELPSPPAPVNIGIVDSGVDFGHPDVNCGDASAPPASFAPDNSFYSSDFTGHGTAVASIAGAYTGNAIGIASSSRSGGPVSIKWLGDDNSGTWTSIRNCIQYAAGIPAIPIVNISAGGVGIQPTELLALRRACQEAFKNDHLLIASSGNRHDSTLSYPAALNPYVLAVGATLWNNSYWTHHNAWPAWSDSLSESTGSRFGSWVDLCAPGGIGVTAARPGQRVPMGTGPGMYELDNTLDASTVCNLSTYCSNNLTAPCEAHSAFGGTSAAAPVVSGLAAWLKGLRPSLHAEDLVQILLRTTSDLGATGFDVYFGAGRVNARTATRYVLDNWTEYGAVGSGAPSALAVVDSTTGITLSISNGAFGSTPLNDTYPCVRYRLAGSANFTSGFAATPALWIRRAHTIGLPATSSWDDAADVSWAATQSPTTIGAGFETYVYRLPTLGNIFYPIRLIPRPPESNSRPWGYLERSA